MMLTDARRLINKVRRTNAISFVDMTVVTADLLKMALERSIVVARIGDAPDEMVIHREDRGIGILTIRFANRAQAHVFVASSNAWLDPKITVQLSEIHWSLTQAARAKSAA